MKQSRTNQLNFNILSAAEMVNFGGKLAQVCKGIRCVIYLSGELGAGKTTLARGFLQMLGYERSVKSPTYTIVEPYEIEGIKLYHFDLYRLTNAEELTYIGALDYFTENAIFLIEWAEKGKGVLPPPDLVCQINIVDSDGSGDYRLVMLESGSNVGDVILQRLTADNC